jgi:hypothetical protein
MEKMPRDPFGEARLTLPHCMRQVDHGCKAQCSKECSGRGLLLKNFGKSGQIQLSGGKEVDPQRIRALSLLAWKKNTANFGDWR